MNDSDEGQPDAEQLGVIMQYWKCSEFSIHNTVITSKEPIPAKICDILYKS